MPAAWTCRRCAANAARADVPPLLRALVRAPPRRPRGRRRGGRPLAGGWPGWPRPTGGGCCSTWCGRRSPRCSATRAPTPIEADRAFKDARLRLADRGGAAQPAQRGHRAAAARHRRSSTTRRPQALAERLRAELLGAPTPAAADAPAAGGRRPTSRSRSSAMACRYPGGVAYPGGAVAAGRATGSTRSASSRPTGAGTSTASYDPDPDSRARATPGRAASCTTRTTSTPSSSASAPGRRWRSTRSSGCCWRRPGRPWSGPASTRPRCAAAAPACSSASSAQDYGAAAARAAPRRSIEGYLLHRQHRQRGLRPDRLHLRAGGPGGDRRHRLLVLAGRHSTWPRRRCAAASATWRWPAA